MSRRTRDPEAHRAAILDAAHACFTERGYARATIRDIARRAEVTHGLVLRHFGTKEQLFLAAVPGPRDLAGIIAGDPDTLPDRLASAFVDRMDDAEHADPLIALIRATASNEQAATTLYRAMREHSAQAYRAVLSDQDAEVRIDLLTAHLIGVAFHRRIIGTGPLAQMPSAELADHLARTLRHILFASLDQPGEHPPHHRKPGSGIGHVRPDAGG